MPNILLAVSIPLYIPIICFVLGIIFCIIEMFTPGFGVFGTIGILLLLSGIVIRAVSGGGIWEVIITTVAVIALLVTLVALTAKSARSGKLSKSPIVLSQSAVPTDKTEGTLDFEYLIGKSGEAITFLRPVGKAKIEDKIYDVISEESEIIEKGEKISVIAVEGQKIVVKKI